MTPPDTQSTVAESATRPILLVGNPNVGKSVLFGALTRRYVTVSNYPGTTVEVARGTTSITGERRELVDLPGVNNLIPQSEDERVTRDVLLTGAGDTVLQVTDAKNLRRGLLISLALAEMRVPFVLILNMMDEALARGVRIHMNALSHILGVPVHGTVATRGKGIQRLKAALTSGGARSAYDVRYDPGVEEAVEKLVPLLPESHITARSLALMVLGGDEGIREWMRDALSAEDLKEARRIRRAAQSRQPQALAYVITQARLRHAAEIMERVYRVDPAVSGAIESVARFGESVTGRGVAHGSVFLGAVLILLSMGGFSFSPILAAIAGAVVAAAILSGRSRRASSLVFFSIFAAVYLTGAAVRPLSDLLPAEAWFRSGWFQGFGGILIVSGVLLGRLGTSLVWGTVGAFSVLFMTYLFVGVFGAGDLVDLLEGTVFQGWLSPFFSSVVGAIFPTDATGTWGSIASFLNAALVGEYGALTMALSYSVAILLPVVSTFFLVFGLLEDSGYLPRLAVMMNRAFRAMGLNGKAVLPMVLGLGCDTMATLTTRVLETRKERIIVTLLLALGVPCSAQLGVILGITSQIGSAAILWWLGTVAFVLFAVGWLSSKLLRGESSEFILELPPLRVPRIGNILLKTLARIEWYLKEAVPIFFLGTLVLFLLDRFGALGPIQDAAAPIVKGLLGLPGEATPPLMIGFLRRDYGAAGLADLWGRGLLTPRQAVVALVTITLFVPCIANFFVMIKERGFKVAVAMFLFIFPFAFLVGGIVNLVTGLLGVLE